MTPYFVSLLSNFSSKMKPKSARNDPETAPRCPWAPKDGAKVAPKTTQIHPSAPRDRPKGSQNGAQMASRAQNGTKKKPKWSPNGTQTVSTRVKNNENRTQLVSETHKRRDHAETMKLTAHMKLQSFESENHAALKRRNPKNRSNRNL